MNKNVFLSKLKIKIWACILHFIAFILFIVGISIIYCNDNFKKGLLWMNAESYDESPAFMSQVDSDISLLFTYANLREVFETDGRFDLNKDIFGLNMGPSNDVNFSVGSIIEYAKRHGYYIDEHYQVSVVDQKLVDQIEDTSYFINYRIYANSLDMVEPSDAYISMKTVITESLGLLAKYYNAYERFVLIPSNFRYRLEYGDTVYTNDRSLNIKSVYEYGKYALTFSDSMIVETNLRNIPKELAFQSEKLSDKLPKPYRVYIAVNTVYTATDIYAIENVNYLSQRRAYSIGLVSVTVGIILMIISLGYLLIFSGHSDKKQGIQLNDLFDVIPFEVKILLLIFFIVVLFAINNFIGQKVLHIYIEKENWDFANQMLDYASIYLAALPIAFSILREYKAGLLWKNSYIKVIKESFSIYMLKRTFKKKLVSDFLLLIIVDIVIMAFFLLTTINEKSLLGRLMIFIAFIVFLIINFIIFNKVYKTAIAFDKIADAIKEIANGDTRYRLNESEFNGRVSEVVKDLNNISMGFQGAINDQVKSERLKADLITNVSHDIKTPLTSIINYVDLIKREKPENAKIQEYLDILSVKSQHLKNLTEDLVEASKVSSGNISVDLRDIDLVEMINQTNGEFEDKFAEKGLNIISNLPPAGVIIKADGRHLWRVLENLYNNAFKYAARDSRIYIDVVMEDSIAKFVIKNISENPLNIRSDELTERFVRGDVSRTTEGSGLGLSIAKSLTMLQGGKFEIIIDGDLFKVQLRFVAVLN